MQAKPEALSYDSAHFMSLDCRPHQLDCGIYLIQQKGSIVHTDNLILYSINESML